MVSGATLLARQAGLTLVGEVTRLANPHRMFAMRLPRIRLQLQQLRHCQKSNEWATAELQAATIVAAGSDADAELIKMSMRDVSQHLLQLVLTTSHRSIARSATNRLFNVANVMALYYGIYPSRHRPTM